MRLPLSLFPETSLLVGLPLPKYVSNKKRRKKETTYHSPRDVYDDVSWAVFIVAPCRPPVAVAVVVDSYSHA